MRPVARPGRARPLWSALAAAALAAALGAAAAAHADSTATLSVSVSAQAVSISVTGGAVNFGGPHGANVTLQAHPQESVREALPPTLTNTGNTSLTFVQVTFSGPAGAEASCDSDTTSWAAHASAAGTDQFVMKAWASTSSAFTNFTNSAVAVAPSTGTGNILATGDSPIAQNGAVPILLELRMPNPPVAGSGGCTIGLVVTAAATG